MISVVSKHHRLSKQLLRRFSTKESVPEVKAVSREVRREMRKRASSQPAISSPANVVTPAKEGTSPWPIFGRVMGLGSFAGAVTWFGLLDEDSKKNVTKSLSASFLGSTYRFVETQVQTIAKPFTDPSRDKLIPVSFSNVLLIFIHEHMDSNPHPLGLAFTWRTAKYSGTTHFDFGSRRYISSLGMGSKVWMETCQTSRCG